jgi:hypothetical protein
MRTTHFLLILALALFTGSAASADSVTFKIQATVDHIHDPDHVLAQRIRLGDTFSGTYSFDTNVSDTASSPLYGFYNQSNNNLSGFELRIKTLSAQAIKTRNTDFHSINTWNDQSDFYYVENKMYSPIGDGLAITFIGLEVFDVSGQALYTDQLTHNPPSISFARDKNILVSGRAENSTADFEFRATITSITLFTDKKTIAQQEF